MRYGQIRKYDTANGLGIRTSIFFTGCTLDCEGCFNKLYQDFSYGNIWTQEHTDLIKKYLQEPQISGLTLLGGEPTEQNIDEIIPFLQEIRNSLPKNKNIWIYSGYKYEEIIKNDNKLEIIKLCDILVDGRFIYKLKDLRLKFRGSSNQRIIDIQKSLQNNNVTIYLD